jgi:glucose-6-phosphate 1-dehydrogenase
VVGASGDLAKKKTYPALYALWKEGLLPESTVIWGFARSAKSHEGLRGHLKTSLPLSHHDEDDAKSVDRFLANCFYRQGSSYGDWEAVEVILKETSCQNVLVYLAIPPNVFGESAEAVMRARKTWEQQAGGFFRVVLEKPFGRDTASCQELLQTLEKQKWPEHELYRIDHYLGKEMVQNLMTLRQCNPWINTIWNKNTIQAVHLVFKEPFGTEGRGGYFDPFGIIRDILQNHLLQVLTLVAMDLPTKWSANDIRNAKVKVLKNMSTIKLEDCLLGQYDGYKDDNTIENRDTVSPTYACIHARVNTKTWKGVPFIMEAGKALDEGVCEVRLHFHGSSKSQPNALVLRLQPTPAIYFTTNLKTPGFSSTPVSTHLGIDYEVHKSAIPDAYTRLLLDVLRGQQANFVRDDELDLAWKIFTPVLHQTERDQVQPLSYEQGSTGPSVRDEFLHAAGVSNCCLPPAAAL